MRRPAAVLTAAVLALGALTSGCTSEETPGGRGGVGPAKIDVDTPALRALKREAGVEPCRAGKGAPVDGGLPDVTLPCLGGGTSVNLSELRGPMIINLFASWCGPCAKEMPLIQQFHERYGDQVAVLGIDYQDPQVQGAMELVQDSGVTYPLLADPQAALDGTPPFPRLGGLPYWAFVDEDGHFVGKGQYNAFESEQELVDTVEEQLGVDL